MCTGVELGLLLTAAGTGTKAVNQMISGRRQDRAAAAGLRRQGELQREGSQSVRERIAEVGRSDPAAERAEALEGFLNTLRGAEDITGAGTDPLGIGGERFAERVAGGEAQTRQEGREAASRESIISGAINQRRRETGRTGDLINALREVGTRSQAEDFITQLRVASKRPNELVNMLGSVLEGAGSIAALKPPTGENLLSKFASGSLVDVPVRPNPFTGVPS
jgi:hypothetical protein